MNIVINGSHLVLFLLIVSRIAGISAIGPVFGDRAIPSQLKIGISCLLALTVFPSLAASASTPNIGEPLSIFILVVKETAVGLAIGYMARLLFFGLQLGAYMVDFQMGLGMAGVFDPSSGTQSTHVGILTNWVALIFFLAINGHHRLIIAVAESFDTIPIGGMTVTSGLLELVIRQIAYTTQIAIGLFGPVIVVLGAAELIIGVISKSAPQMNVFVVSLPLKIGLGVASLALWISTLEGPLSQVMRSQFSVLAHFIRLLGAP